MDFFDYSSKYGLGYVCSDGNVGAYFNDATMMILDPRAEYGVLLLTSSRFEYLYQENSSPKKQFVKLEFTVPEFPAELSKKMTVLKYFQGTFENAALRRQGVIFPATGPGQMEFLVKYATVDELILFRLSTRNIQVVFPDKLSMLLMQEGLMIGIIDNGSSAPSINDMHVMPLQQLACREPYSSRLLLLRIALGKLIFGNNNPNNK